MLAAVQGSLFDGGDGVGMGSLHAVRRRELSGGAWLDVLPGWLTGADTLFERLVSRVPWRAERRHMYDRVVAVPRLLAFYDEHDPLPDRILERARAALSRHYAAELGEPFRTDRSAHASAFSFARAASVDGPAGATEASRILRRRCSAGRPLAATNGRPAAVGSLDGCRSTTARAS